MDELKVDDIVVSKSQKMSRFEIELAILFFLFYVMYMGSEVSFSPFIYTYTQLELWPLLNSTSPNWVTGFLSERIFERKSDS